MPKFGQVWEWAGGAPIMAVAPVGPWSRDLDGGSQQWLFVWLDNPKLKGRDRFGTMWVGASYEWRVLDDE